MLGFAALGMEKSGAENRLQRYFTRIHESAARLLALVDDLLDLAKLEARKMIVHPQRQDVLPILEQVQGELDPLLAAGRIDVVVACADCDTTALVDAPRFAQVLRNLLSNAIRFSPAGGSIRIEFSPSRLPRGRRASDHGTVAALALRIIDQGPGIPTDELESIFDKFVQSTRTRTGAGGTGLGLAICLEIMNAHRGRIYAENAPTGGACLVVILPAEDPFTPVQESSA
jgi:signal transduction histidine kinase